MIQTPDPWPVAGGLVAAGWFYNKTFAFFTFLSKHMGKPLLFEHFWGPRPKRVLKGILIERTRVVMIQTPDPSLVAWWLGDGFTVKPMFVFTLLSESRVKPMLFEHV